MLCYPCQADSQCYNTLLHPFNGLFSWTTWVSQYQKGKTSLDLNEARDDAVMGCSGISWSICKQSAPRSRQITTPTPQHSIFTDWMLFLMPNQQCQSTEGISQCTTKCAHAMKMFALIQKAAKSLKQIIEVAHNGLLNTAIAIDKSRQ